MTLSDPSVNELVQRLLHPGRFFAPYWQLQLIHEPREVLLWEIFQGRLLDSAHTRQSQTFTSWNLHADGPGAGEVVLSIKHDRQRELLHVVRSVEGYVWEGYDSGGGVIESRERRKWIRELVATFPIENANLETELTFALARAVTGTRLPLTPVESPIPGFSFGWFFYGPTQNSPATADEMLCSWLGKAEEVGEQHRVLEAWLRTLGQADRKEVINRLTSIWQRLERPFSELLPLFRRVLDDISLSPWTSCTSWMICILEELVARGEVSAKAVVDWYGSVLRLLCRHLTAYDLVTFHYRGANYPDALLLDELLKHYLNYVERLPELFQGDSGKMRRRALRQGYLLRRRYEGHPVPETPTSPGERARVYPSELPRASEEQILQPSRRKELLYRGDLLQDRLNSALRDAVLASFADLAEQRERQELGAAVFLDRPFGGGKLPVEPDGTPLIASLAYSRFVALSRLRLLGRDLGQSDDVLAPWVTQLSLPGWPLEAIGLPTRQGTVSLSDAGRASADFVFLHTMPASRQRVHSCFDWSGLNFSFADRSWLLVQASRGPGLQIVEPQTKTILMEIEPLLAIGYTSHRGLELPTAGLQITVVEGRKTNRIVQPRWES